MTMYTCKTCNMTFVDDPVVHYNSLEHYYGLRSKFYEVSEITTDTDVGSHLHDCVRGYQCQLCDVKCTGSSSLEEHKKGRSHLYKESLAKMPNKRFSCDRCHVECTDQTALDVHNKGKRHYKNMRYKVITITEEELEDASN